MCSDFAAALPVGSHPPGCRPAGCDMFIPGFNDATHKAVVWICDELPAEAQRQQLVQAPGTCQARAGPPPVVRQPGLASLGHGAYGWPPGPAGSYEAYAAAGGKAAAGPGAMQSRAWAAATVEDTPSLTSPTSVDLLIAASANHEAAVRPESDERQLTTMPGLVEVSVIQLQGAGTSAASDGATAPANRVSDASVMVQRGVSIVDLSIANSIAK
jgi:hypothetical protein